MIIVIYMLIIVLQYICVQFIVFVIFHLSFFLFTYNFARRLNEKKSFLIASILAFIVLVVCVVSNCENKYTVVTINSWGFKQLYHLACLTWLFRCFPNVRPCPSRDNRLRHRIRILWVRICVRSIVCRTIHLRVQRRWCCPIACGKDRI